MIITSKLPDVVWNKGRHFPISEGWLTETIKRSACAAGYKRWSLAGQVARAITVYLVDDWQTTTPLCVEHLRDMIRRSLQGIGFGDIAETTEVTPPRLTLSLVEIAERHPDAAKFYAVLRERLSEALEVQLGGIGLCDLRGCCRVLAGAKRWTRACDLIHDELVTFCRDHLVNSTKGDVDMIIR